MTRDLLNKFMDASQFMEHMANKHPEIMKGWKDGTLMVEEVDGKMKIVEKQDYERRQKEKQNDPTINRTGE